MTAADILDYQHNAPAVARLTKVAVLDEVHTVRHKVTDYLSMTPEQLEAEYRGAFTTVASKNPTVNEMLHSLIMSAIYYMTNVLNLE